jgi:3-deoxy-D-manno-octulosonic-acid transferase
VGGNMKFDLDPPDPSDPVACSLRRTRAGGWRVLVAGSVHPGEARTVFEGAERVRRRGVHLGVVVAPRHLERLPEIEKNLAEAGGSAVRYSALESPLEASFLRAFKEGKTILVDRYGLLGRLYGGAELAFVGGSLVPVGGHNLLEPLRWGVPVLFGPHMESASEVRNAVVTRKLGREVREAESVSRILEEYLGDEAAMLKVHSDSEAFFAANHGATRRVLDSLRSVGALDRQRQA